MPETRRRDYAHQPAPLLQRLLFRRCTDADAGIVHQHVDRRPNSLMVRWMTDFQSSSFATSWWR